MVMQTASDRKKMEELVGMIKATTPAIEAIKPQATEDMGKWIGEYLDANGYRSWPVNPDFFKIMITSVRATNSANHYARQTLLSQACEACRARQARVLRLCWRAVHTGCAC